MVPKKQLNKALKKVRRKAKIVAVQFNRPDLINDLQQAASVALIEAARSYDPKSKWALHIYAFYRVHSAIYTELSFYGIDTEFKMISRDMDTFADEKDDFKKLLSVLDIHKKHSSGKAFEILYLSIRKMHSFEIQRIMKLPKSTYYFLLEEAIKAIEGKA